MEQVKKCYAIIEGMKGELFRSPLFEDEGSGEEKEILKSAHCKAVGWITEHLRREEMNATKYAAIVSLYYEGDLIQSEFKSFYYEW